MKSALIVFSSILSTLPAFPQATQILEPLVTAAEHGYSSDPKDVFDGFALQSNTAFGHSISANQGTLLVGAPGKSLLPAGCVVYRYQFDSTSRTWSFDEAMGLNNMKGGRFGSSVATEGGRFLIGMSQAAVFGNGPQEHGMAFFADHGNVTNTTFEDPGSDSNDIVSFGHPDLKLFGNNMVLGRANDRSEFGAAVNFTGDTAIVGAPLDLDAGAAYIYEYNEVADLPARFAIEFAQQLVPNPVLPQPQTGQRYGAAVSVSDNLAIVVGPDSMRKD